MQIWQSICSQCISWLWTLSISTFLWGQRYFSRTTRYTITTLFPTNEMIYFVDWSHINYQGPGQKCQKCGSRADSVLLLILLGFFCMIQILVTFETFKWSLLKFFPKTRLLCLSFRLIVHIIYPGCPFPTLCFWAKQPQLDYLSGSFSFLTISRIHVANFTAVSLLTFLING